MSFTQDVVDRAWDRQDGKCAKCGKTLSKINRDFGEYGAWHAHHRIPTHLGGSDTLGNCVILCINEPPNCHYEYGHGGISWDYYSTLLDFEMPWLRSGGIGEWLPKNP